MDSCWRNTTLLLSLLFMFYSFSHAANNITRGQSIRDGETIVSDNGDFALGFFTPGNSMFRYVGIWYARLPGQTVVWVANRENPITNFSGSITVASDGNLQVLDGSGRGVWSTNAPNNLSNLLAIIMKNGNLLLCGEEVGNPEKALWQSFEDPTDTYLPGMRAGLNNRIGETRLYSSWKSESDPSKGNFTMGVDPNGLPQIVIWKNSERHWRSGIWNGKVFIGVPNMRVIYLYGFNLSDQGGRMNFTYTALNSSDFLRFRLRWDGVEEQRRWDAGRNEWNTFWSQPTSACQTYNHCGAYASCNAVGSPICTCLQGFVPRSQSEWDRENWSKGCKRRADLQCERNDTGTAKEDRFLALNGVKLPDNSALRRVENENQCKAECSGNCSCRAYAYASVKFRCLTWTQDLVDIQQFPDIQQSDAMDNRLYIRLAHSEIGSKKTSVSKKKSVLTLVLVLSLVLGTIFVSIFAFLIWRCKRKSRIPKFLRKNQAVVLDGNQSRDMWMNFNEQHDIGEANEGSMPELPLLSFESIAATTNNFSEEFKLGQGGFGPVYKGNMPCGLEVAIKRLSRKSGQGIEEFKNEVILIAKLQHRNLVRLLGCCIQGEERILVYEYMSNKSLDAFIFNSTTGVQLNWKKRFDIIEGIARGLLYLHRDSRLRIIHRDLKASNILLDGEMIPKISDFGMAKIFGGNENQENTNRVVGTYGYMAPEYAMEGLFSVKSDVYSFGVLLLEIFSGKKCTQFRDPDHGLNLLGYVWKLWNEQKAMEFIDPSIRETCSEAEVLKCIQVGLLCVQDSAIDRPIMSSVVLMLGSESTVLPKARQPMFTIGRTPLEMDVSIDSSETMSRNNVTVTMLVGR